MSNEIEEKIKLQQQIAMIEENAKKFLDKRAVERFGTLKTAHPEKALQAASVIFQASQAGQLQKELTDDEFKQLLSGLQEPKKEFTLTRK